MQGLSHVQRNTGRIVLGTSLLAFALMSGAWVAGFPERRQLPASTESVDVVERVTTRSIMGMRLIDIDGEMRRIGGESASRPSVFVLLDTGCPIANRYAPDLNALYERSIRAGIEFYGVISDPLVTAAEARKFRDERELRYPILYDATGDLALALDPAAVPQAFVLDGNGEIVYRGRIDNRFESVGRLRQVITSHDLRDAIDTVAVGGRVANPTTTPVGCAFEAWDNRLPETVTYTQHIAPILAANCLDCHAEGGVAPFHLNGYRAASRRAGMVAQVTGEGLMPPWPADPSFRRFKDERTLTDRQVAFFRRWAETGAPRGDARYAIPPREPAPAWPLGEPDAVVTMEEPYEIPGTGPDQYRRFVMKSPFKEPTVVSEIAFNPGDSGVVHHANFFYDDSGDARARDAADPGIGYDAFGDNGGMESASRWDTEGYGIGGWAPGSGGYKLPEGVGLLLPPGGDIVVEIHYHLNGRATTDQSSVAFYLADAPVDRYIDQLMIGTLSLEIEAGDAEYTRHVYMDVPVDMELVDLMPHMHYLGKRVRVEATTPDGEKIPLLKIDDWDFRWQATYRFPKTLKIPAGSRIDAWFTFDNSADNPDNPHHPPVDVSWGFQSTDEMLELYLTTIYTSEKDSEALQRASLMSFYRYPTQK
ncbi:MAG: redoxin domain-containing protein [Planctomycetota bacterium]